MTAPVQVLVVGVDEPQLSGQVLTELARLREAGIVRLVDLLLVTRATDGSFDTLPVPGLPPEAGRVVAALLGTAGGGAEADSEEPTEPAAWSLAEVVPAGSIAAVALVEHTWAERLRDAIHTSGGRPLDETWLAPEDLAALEQLAAAPAD